MPEYCVQRIRQILNEGQKCVNGAKLLFLGVAYKRDTSDVRESPALDIMRLLEAEGALIDYSDPFVPELRWNGTVRKNVPLSEEVLGGYDLVALLTDHSCFDYGVIQRGAPVIFDSRNAFKTPADNIKKL